MACASRAVSAAAPVTIPSAPARIPASAPAFALLSFAAFRPVGSRLLELRREIARGLSRSRRLFSVGIFFVFVFIEFAAGNLLGLFEEVFLKVLVLFVLLFFDYSIQHLLSFQYHQRFFQQRRLRRVCLVVDFEPKHLRTR